MTDSGSSSTPVGVATISRWRKLVRRVLLLWVGMLILLAGAFFLLPVWISNEQGRLYVLDRLNDHLHGPRVAVDEWSLGWFRTTELKNLRILAPDGTTIITCPHVSLGLTLWDIFWGNYDIRNTTADKLELRIARNMDGSTSLDSFAEAADILRATRGALQVNNGQITIYAARSGQTARYNDAKATITIASPDAPFHVQITALGEGDAMLSLTGTFPPTSTLSAKNLAHPGIWALVNDMDFAAGRLPSGLACDYLKADGAWADSFGETLETVQFAAHPPPPAAGGLDGTHVTLVVRGNVRGGEAAELSARLVLRAPGAEGTGGSLTAAAPGYVSAALRQSVPLARLLGRVNPVLGEISPVPGGGGGLVRGNVAVLTLPLDHPENAEAALRVTFPPLLFTARDGPSLLRQLQVTFGEMPRANARIAGGAEALRASLSKGQFHYENFLVSLGTRRVNFTGNVSLEGKVELTAQIPDMSAGLAASATMVEISGTTDAPLLKRAE